jgi:hypothetical protein
MEETHFVMSLLRRARFWKRSDRAANRTKKKYVAQHAQNVTAVISVEEFRGDRARDRFLATRGNRTPSQFVARR